VTYPEVVDQVIRVEEEAAFETARRVAREEGMLCGISGGAAVWRRSRWRTARTAPAS
jgi:cysteine synthase